MTMERSARIMDDIFTSQEEEGKGRILKIIQDFLVSEAVKHGAKEKGFHIPKPLKKFMLMSACRIYKSQEQDRRRQHGGADREHRWFCRLGVRLIQFEALTEQPNATIIVLAPLLFSVISTTYWKLLCRRIPKCKQLPSTS